MLVDMLKKNPAKVQEKLRQIERSTKEAPIGPFFGQSSL